MASLCSPLRISQVDSKNETPASEKKSSKETINFKELKRVDHIFASLQRKVCRVWLDQIEYCHVTTRLSHTSCGYFLDEGSSEDLKCNFCQRKCNAEVARSFHLKITLADESGKHFAWCTGQTASLF